MEVTLTDVPMALPARCAYCGVSSRDRGPYLDTGLQFEYYGALLTCRECFTHLAGKYNFIPPETATLLQEKNSLQDLHIKELEFKITALEQAINSMKAAGFTDGNSGLDSDLPARLISIHDFSGGQTTGQLVFGEGTELGEGSDGVIESSDDEGMAELSPGESEPNPFSIS